MKSLLKHKKLSLLAGIGLLAILLQIFPGSDSAEIPPPLALDQKTLDHLLSEKIDYRHQVKPLLDKRCVVCHGCYDAPCQLKLSSSEGQQRGASKTRVYEPRRIERIDPTRLFIDAKTPQQWREKGFYPILNEKNNNTKDNLQYSLLYQMLLLKQQHPQPATTKLPEDFSLELDRKQSCPRIGEFNRFRRDHPLWGMPYAMPGLDKAQHQLLVSWLAQGAKVPAAQPVSPELQQQINHWEQFLNQPDNRHKLVSRYLYEHLFHAHLHFKGSSPRQFFRLIRSHTAPASPADEIATERPTDAPGVKDFYYRIIPYQATIVIKNHLVYELSERRMQRFNELFFKPDYRVNTLPPYNKENAFNPFEVYAAIPAVSRYRFMLDDAAFFIDGFIKGPVCRGQLALNVIEDRFWVVFFDPDKPIITNDSHFLQQMAPQLQLPEDLNKNLDIFRIWTDYWKGQLQYMESKQNWLQKIGPYRLESAMNYIWDGDGHNPAAALTVFRHFDSGSVAYGLLGDDPETTWIIDFPLFERIHYLLVADFNIFGNIGHRLSTRIYMDFLRMEGEDAFLAFLPASKRKAIRDQWYIGQREDIKKLFAAPQQWLSKELVTGYKTSQPQHELNQHIQRHMKKIKPVATNMNHCGGTDCHSSLDNNLQKKVDQAMQKIAQLKGAQLHAFPDVAFVRVETGQHHTDMAYTLIRNKAYKNVTSFLADARERDRADIEKDTMTVVNWLEGFYPNFFFKVHIDEIEEFAHLCAAIKNREDYTRFVDRYGVRRTNPAFWEMADWFQDRQLHDKPLQAGLFDLNRYHNL